MTDLVERIGARARAADPMRTLRLAASLPFYALGYAAGLGFFVLAWCWAAVVVGFGDGRRSP